MVQINEKTVDLIDGRLDHIKDDIREVEAYLRQDPCDTGMVRHILKQIAKNLAETQKIMDGFCQEGD